MRQHTVNITGWTQREINWIHAAALSLLYAMGATQKITSVQGALINYEGDSWPIADPDLRARILADLAAQDATAAAENAVLVEAETELESNPLTRYSLAEVDAFINNIATLADAKVALKRLARFLKALIRVRGLQ